MLKSAYLAPTESPVSLVDVKRALLTFDRVILADPGDRDLIPPQSFMMAIGMPPIFGLNTGPVRPLGKYEGHDESFDQLMDGIQIARRQGIVDVVSSFERATSAQFTVGAVPMGDYPLDPGFMLSAYRNVARDPEILKTALVGDDQLMALPANQIESLCIVRSLADGAINDDPSLPLIEGDLSREGLREQLTYIARGRIASTMKSIGYCASKDFVPVFGHNNFRALARAFAARATQVIDRVGGDDPYWSTRGRALNLAHDEYINDAILSQMPIDEVLKLRTSVWGNQAAARDNLFHSIAGLARDALTENDFDEAVRRKIRSYRAASEEVQRERAALSFKIKCEIVKIPLGIAASAGGGAAMSGVLSQVQTAMGAGTMLLAGCLWTLNKIQETKPLSDQLRIAESELQDNICFGMHNFYRNLATGVGAGPDF
jgi:hypothetical protein